MLGTGWELTNSDNLGGWQVEESQYKAMNGGGGEESRLFWGSVQLRQTEKLHSFTVRAAHSPAIILGGLIE